jgi:transcriptional regulator with XRE-family HTH domain
MTSEVVMPNDASFADQLKTWRGRRGLAQLALAGRANISQRHLSFLELGRASPSREMVDRLAGALDLPLRQHNALLPPPGSRRSGGSATSRRPILPR